MMSLKYIVQYFTYWVDIFYDFINEILDTPLYFVFTNMILQAGFRMQFYL